MLLNVERSVTQHYLSTSRLEQNLLRLLGLVIWQSCSAKTYVCSSFTFSLLNILRAYASYFGRRLDNVGDIMSRVVLRVAVAMIMIMVIHVRSTGTSMHILVPSL